MFLFLNVESVADILLLMMTCSCVCLLAGVTNWLTVKCGVAELTRHNGGGKMEGDCKILMMGHTNRVRKVFFFKIVGASLKL